MADATKQFLDEYRPFARRAAEKHWLFELIENQQGLIDQVLQATIHEKLVCGSPDPPEEIILEKTEVAYSKAEKQIANKIRRQDGDTLKKFERLYLFKALEYIQKKDEVPDHTTFAKKAYENAFCKIQEGGTESLEKIILKSIIETAKKERIRGNPPKWFVRLDELTENQEGRAWLTDYFYKNILMANPTTYTEAVGPVTITIPDYLGIIADQLPINTEIKREYYALLIDKCVDYLKNWEYEMMRLWCSGLKFNQVGQIFGEAKSTISGWFKEIQAKIQRCLRGEKDE